MPNCIAFEGGSPDDLASGAGDGGSDQTQDTQDGRRGDRDGRDAERARTADPAGRSCHVLLRKRHCPHPLRRGRLRLPAAAHRRRRTELDDRRPGQSLQPDRRVQGRVPLHRVGPAQRQRRPVFRPARNRPAVGCIHRRPSRPDGSPAHREIHGDGLLHRRPLHLEPPAARARSCRRRRAGAAERVASGECAICSTTPT